MWRRYVHAVDKVLMPAFFGTGGHTVAAGYFGVEYRSNETIWMGTRGFEWESGHARVCDGFVWRNYHGPRDRR